VKENTEQNSQVSRAKTSLHLWLPAREQCSFPRSPPWPRVAFAPAGAGA